MALFQDTVNPNSDIESLLAMLRKRLDTNSALPAERTLANELAVKRHQLRKALHVLKEAGELPESVQRNLRSRVKEGAVLARDTNPIEVIELRLGLEPVLARLAALRATPADIARIERAATTLDGTESGTADLVFHKLIAAATHNTLAEKFYGLLREVGTDARLRGGKAGPHRPERVHQRDSEHHAIATAIAQRDPEAAEAAMRSHLTMVQRQILDRITPK